MCRTALLVLLAVTLSVSDAAACGDKFLLVGRGARYQRGYVAVHPGSILLYANTPLTSGRGLRAALKMAGHRVTVAQTRTALEAALGTGKFDILVADGSESRALKGQAVARNVIVVPVLASGAGPLKGSSGKEFCVITSNEKRRNPIAVLDEILGAKLKGTPAPCESSL